MINTDSDIGTDSDIVTGRSLIKYNETVETDLEIIENNNLTILNQLCSPKKIPEGIPPPLTKKVQPEKLKDLKKTSLKSSNSISTSMVCVHQ